MPYLVFLHGLLGSKKDWHGVIAAFSSISASQCILLDLPLHGQRMHSRYTKHYTAEMVLDDLHQHLMHLSHPYWLIGYSLGGRLAMQYAIRAGRDEQTKLQGLIVESGHFGLPKESRKARFMQDEAWAVRFETEPMCDLLLDWYQQTVFSSLNNAQRQSLIALRSDNLGAKVAMLLRATSLSKQDVLSEKLRALPFPFHFICGEKDEKYCQLAQNSELNYHLIKKAGHNVHFEQPKQMADLIEQCIGNV